MHAFKNFASLRLGERFVFVFFTQRRKDAKKFEIEEWVSQSILLVGCWQFE